MVDFSLSIPNPYLLQPDTLTPALVRAARGLLGWPQRELAKRAGIGTATLSGFERGALTPHRVNLRAMATALQEAGIRFVFGPRAIGVVLLT